MRATGISLKDLKREGSDRIKKKCIHLVHCSGEKGVEAQTARSGQVTAGILVETPGARPGAAGARSRSAGQTDSGAA